MSYRGGRGESPPAPDNYAAPGTLCTSHGTNGHSLEQQWGVVGGGCGQDHVMGGD